MSSPKQFSAEDLLAMGTVEVAYSAEDLLSFGEIELTNEEKAAVGQMEIQQDARDIEEAGGRRFVTDAKEEEELGATFTPGESFAIAGADKATFGLTTKIAGKLAGASYEEIKAAKRVSEELNPKAAIGGNIVGYLVNPATRAMAPLTSAATASGNIAAIIGANVAEALVVEGLESFVDVVDAAFQNKETYEAALKTQKDRLIQEGIFSAVVPAGFHSIASIPRAVKGTVKGATKLWSKAAKTWLSESHGVLIDGAEQAMKESPEQFVKDTANLLDRYKSGLSEHITSLKKTGQSAVDETALALDASINRHMTAALEGVVAPEKSLDALTGLLDDVVIAHQALSTKYGHSMAQVDELVQGIKLPADKSAQLLNKTVEILEAEGSAVFDGKVIKPMGPTQFPEALRVLNTLLKKEGLEHNDIRLLSRAINSGANGTGPSADLARVAGADFIKVFRDEKVWGKEAATIAGGVQDDYMKASTAFKAIKKNVANTRTALAAISDSSDETMLKHLSDANKGFQNTLVNIERLGTSKEFGKILPEALQKRAVAGIRQSKELIDFSKARNVKKAHTTLRKYVKGKMPSSTDEQAILDAIEKYAAKDELMAALDTQMSALPAIKAAVKNPFSKKALETASSYNTQYAKLLKDDAQKLIDASAKWHRVAGIKPRPVKAADAAAALGNLVSEKEIMTMRMFEDLAPEAASLLGRAKVAQALQELNPSLKKTLDGPKGLDAMELISTFLGPKALVMVGLIRLAKDPTALRLLTAKLSTAGLSTAQQTTLLRATRVVNAINDAATGGSDEQPSR